MTVWEKSGAGSIFMSGKMKMLRTGTHILYLLSTEESCKSRIPSDARNRLIFSQRWRKKMSFNLHLLFNAESFSWSGVFKSKREWETKQTGRKRESVRGSELGSGAISSLTVLWDCPTAWVQRCQLLGGKRPAECCLLAATLRRFEATWNRQFCTILT